MATRSKVAAARQPLPPTTAVAGTARAGYAGYAAHTSHATRASTKTSFTIYAEAFNRDLKTLTRDVAARYPEDATIFRAEKRVMLVIDTDPLYVIDLVGKYLYDYRTQVYALESGGAEAEQFFLKNEYDSELQAGVNREKVDLVNYIMPKMKECVNVLSEEEKAEYKRLVVSLLDNYVEYLSARVQK
jgi:hypothetical protein